jgi:hypothetical protein
MRPIQILAGLVLATALAACATPTSKQAPTEWDGLQLVKRAGLDLVYVKPGATLKDYRRVMIDPLQVSFDKNWDPEGDSAITKIRGRVDPEKIKTELAELYEETSKKEIEKGNYPVVDMPGDDVLRLTPAIVNLYINAPDRMDPGRTYTYVVDAGSMTLVAELRDSSTNTLLARVIDKQEGSDFGYMQIANSVTNSAEARRIVAKWADQLRDALDRAQKETDGATVAAK